jgi:tetracycline 7-halogenase / FADH2 O2-dependent halogenase
VPPPPYPVGSTAPPPSTPSERPDLAIIGAGLGGSLLALIARRLGLSVLLIDAARHPRFAIGESSTPAGNMILACLADRYNLPRIRKLARYGTWKEAYPDLDVGAKRGFSYFREGGSEEWTPGVDHANECLVAASDDPSDCDTQWYRPSADGFLFEEAVSAGADARQETTVEEVERRGDWHLRLSDGSRVAARMLIDATGSAKFSRQFLGIPEGPPLRTHTRAAFGHYDGVARWQEISGLDHRKHPFPCDDAALHHVHPDGWMWHIRFDSGRVSVGVVTPGVAAPNLEDWIRQRCPAQFREAQLVAPARGIVTTPRLQRRFAEAGGEGWALLPAAAGFVDPLHSTGIALTLAGIERLSRVLQAGSTDFGVYGRSVLAELDHLDRLAAVCYDSIDDFPRFVTATMLYFAASIQYERARAREGNDFRGHFLGADNPELRRVSQEALLRKSDSPGDFRNWVRQAIEPWNDAGLLSPEIPNMYPHTVAPRW